MIQMKIFYTFRTYFPKVDRDVILLSTSRSPKCFLQVFEVKVSKNFFLLLALQAVMNLVLFYCRPSFIPIMRMSPPVSDAHYLQTFFH